MVNAAALTLHSSTFKRDSDWDLTFVWWSKKVKSLVMININYTNSTCDRQKRRDSQQKGTRGNGQENSNKCIQLEIFFANALISFISTAGREHRSLSRSLAL